MFLACWLLGRFYDYKHAEQKAFLEYISTKQDSEGFISPLSTQHIFLNERLDTTAGTINRLLAKYKSPMFGQGDNFVRAGNLYGIDPVLLFAIAGAESTFGKFAPPNYNAFGWNHGKVAFDSYRDAIYTIAYKISVLGYYKEFRQKQTVVSFARAYNNPYWQSYVGKLQWFIDQFNEEANNE